ncbi:unnamed protein product [Cochlearia groenlandica]
MVREIQLPCESDGVCMRCKATPPSEECLTCSTCATPWHVSCLSSPPETLTATQSWQCPDCDCSGDDVDLAAPVAYGSGLVASIRAIEADASLNEAEKAKKRQRLMSGKAEEEEEEEEEKKKDVDGDDMASLLENVNCSICIQVPERPVTTPCGHNFCLKCFQKWVAKRKPTCAKCRSPIPRKVAANPRINSSLVAAIRLARVSKCASVSTPKVYHFISNQDRPDKAFTTDRAVKKGNSNATSGKILVTIPPDHFGPITAENDPTRNQGVLVGESWKTRLDCRQWGVQNPHVNGIAGQSDYGAQSVAISGGYKDDEDHGEWFLYTGSGGRDLSGNKRTNKDQSFDQTFKKQNEALRVSCKMGYPVRVVRAHKAKHSAYAPQEGIRYDGIYRVEKCWIKVGIQGTYKVCRYLLIRCDNEPAPWTSDEHGDRPRPLPNIPELKEATDLFVREESPSWDFDEAEGRWKWMKTPPASRRAVNALNPEERKTMRKAIKASQNNTIREKLLKEFSCQICKQAMSLPVTTPCAHNFCKACLEAKFAGMSQVNREMMEVIEKLKKKEEKPVVANDEEEEEENNTEESEEEETSQGGVVVSEEEEEEETSEGGGVVSEDEPPSKKMKLDIETTVAEAAPTVTV